MSNVANKVEKISAAVSLSTASFVAPSFAMSEAINETAAITPSLKNTLLSVVAGGVVLAALAAAVIGVHLLIRSRESNERKEHCLTF